MRDANDTSTETKSLLEAVRGGDRRGLDRLVRKYRPYLKQVVTLRMDSMLQARLDPSDVVQEAQMEALRRVEDFADNPTLPLRLWLRQIACDRLQMAQRRHIGAARRSVKREISLPEQSSVSIARQLIAGIGGPSDEISRREVARQVRDAIAGLSETDREIILLHNFEGLTSGESAQVLGIQPAAARKRYGRALLRLRQLLIDHGLGGSQP